LIALDASALLAIVLDEPEAPTFGPFMLLHDCVLATPTALEAHLGLIRFQSKTLHDALASVLTSRTVSIVPFDLEHMRIARLAYERYGRAAKHPARLNFGDCMSYAVAKKLGAPLLFKGNDFIHTDITPAIRP
jgi:ribonuclease VapC